MLFLVASTDIFSFLEFHFRKNEVNSSDSGEASTLRQRAEVSIDDRNTSGPEKEAGEEI